MKSMNGWDVVGICHCVVLIFSRCLWLFFVKKICGLLFKKKSNDNVFNNNQCHSLMIIHFALRRKFMFFFFFQLKLKWRFWGMPIDLVVGRIGRTFGVELFFYDHKKKFSVDFKINLRSSNQLYQILYGLL